MEYLEERSTGTIHFFRDEEKTISIEAETKEAAEQIYNAHHTPLADKKRKKQGEIKQAAEREIQNNYSIYDQINFALGVAARKYNDSAEVTKMKQFIETQVKKKDNLISQIEAATTEEDLNNISW